MKFIFQGTYINILLLTAFVFCGCDTQISNEKKIQGMISQCESYMKVCKEFITLYHYKEIDQKLTRLYEKDFSIQMETADDLLKSMTIYYNNLRVFKYNNKNNNPFVNYPFFYWVEKNKSKIINNLSKKKKLSIHQVKMDEKKIKLDLIYTVDIKDKQLGKVEFSLIFEHNNLQEVTSLSQEENKKINHLNKTLEEAPSLSQEDNKKINHLNTDTVKDVPSLSQEDIINHLNDALKKNITNATDIYIKKQERFCNVLKE